MVGVRRHRPGGFLASGARSPYHPAMALEFLVNPRSAPRARVRCRYSAVVGALALQGQTEDVGPHGCQLVAPRPVPRGSGIQLVLQIGRAHV